MKLNKNIVNYFAYFIYLYFIQFSLISCKSYNDNQLKAVFNNETYENCQLVVEDIFIDPIACNEFSPIMFCKKQFKIIIRYKASDNKICEPVSYSVKMKDKKLSKSEILDIISQGYAHWYEPSDATVYDFKLNLVESYDYKLVSRIGKPHEVFLIQEAFTENNSYPDIAEIKIAGIKKLIFVGYFDH